jgi:hypothetical protein
VGQGYRAGGAQGDGRAAERMEAMSSEGGMHNGVDELGDDMREAYEVRG